MAVAVGDIEVSGAVNGHTGGDVQSRCYQGNYAGVNLVYKTILTSYVDSPRGVHRHAIRPVDTGNEVMFVALNLPN